ncbi:MAG TPA: alpha-L-fucosidase, partial [Candidatus Hydrogenedentes bacterium]|nr:alpha-L-fucosidase [Candidatus Hydrogenedentota bacterium]
DDQWGAGIGSGGKTADPAKQAEYNEVLRRQWTEVLTNYGEISELWFDGSCVVDLSDVLKKHAPNAMVFQGPHATLRWPGNEAGVCPDPAWQTVRRADAASGVATGTLSDPDGETWLPMEMDTTLLDHKWFWAPNTDHMLKSVDKLMDIYCQSVGRGGVLLLNATPDTTGLIPESHMQRYREFGKAILALYAGKVGETAGTGTELVLKLDRPAEVTHVVIRENIEKGHVVRAFAVEGLSDGKWRRLARAQSLGYKRIERFAPATVEALRLRVTEAVDTPEILQFAAYGGGDVSTAGAGKEADWTPVPGFQDFSPPDQWQGVEADLTSVIPRPGEYRLEIVRTSGDGELETEAAMLLIAGVEAPRLVTPGSAPNTWLVRRTDQVTDDEKGKTVLRLRLRRVGGEWTGKIRIRPGTDSGS